MTLGGPSSEPQTLAPAIGGAEFSSLPGIGMLPYLAGLIDGEGCIGIQRSGKRQLPTFAVRIDVGMAAKAKPLLDGLQAHLGGQVRRTRQESGKWSEAWCWALHGAKAAELLAAILPWLQLKREQALIGLAFQVELDRWRAEGRRRNHPWPESLRTTGQRAWGRCRELNAKGPAVAMTAQPVAYLVAGQWTSPKAGMFGEREPVRMPTNGTMRAGVIFAEESPASPTTTASLPTPRTGPNRSSRRALTMEGHWSAPSLEQALEIVRGILPREYESWEEVQGWHGALLRTPQAQVTEPKPGIKLAGRTPQDPQVGLADQIMALLPTPAARDWKGTAHGDHRSGGPDLSWEVERMLPTPTARDERTYDRTPSQKAGNHGLYLTAEVSMASRGEHTERPSSATPSSSLDDHPTLWTVEDD